MNALRPALAPAYAFVLAVALASPSPAAIVRCKSDPTVVLSDGTVLDLTADINAALWDISSVSYVIHVPANTWAIAVIRTPNWPTTKEKFAIYADSPKGCFVTSTTACTRYKTDVSAQLIIDTSLLKTCIAVKSGISGQAIELDTAFH